MALAQNETLYTIAEIGATLAGFAALAGVLGSRGSGTAAGNFANLWGVVLISLSLVIFSLVPVVVAEFGVSTFAVWRVSSAIFLVLMTAAGAIGMRHIIRPAAVINWVGKAVMFPGMALASAILLANALGISEQYAAASFLGVLLFYLSLAVVQFLLLLTDAFMPNDDE
jgi:hypothetical protein